MTCSQAIALLKERSSSQTVPLFFPFPLLFSTLTWMDSPKGETTTLTVCWNLMSNGLSTPSLFYPPIASPTLGPSCFHRPLVFHGSLLKSSNVWIGTDLMTRQKIFCVWRVVFSVFTGSQRFSSFKQSFWNTKGAWVSNSFSWSCRKWLRHDYGISKLNFNSCKIFACDQELS